jgi:hypothetical protein
MRRVAFWLFVILTALMVAGGITILFSTPRGDFLLSVLPFAILAGLFGLAAQRFATGASRESIWTRPRLIWTIIPLSLVAYPLYDYMYLRKVGLTGEHRAAAIKGATAACLNNPIHKDIPASILIGACNCYANAYADQISINDIRFLTSGGLTQEAGLAMLQESPAMQAKQKAAYYACAYTVSSSPK